MVEKKELGKIDRTMLGFEDHGILTCFVFLDFGGKSQGFGGYAIDNEDMNKVIKGILGAAHVREWEDLVGKYVFAVYEPNKSSSIIGLEPALPGEGKPFYFKDVYPK